MSDALLTIKQLSWQVKDKVILSGINLAIKQGQFVGIIGTNGAGKSSLLRAIYRYIKPTAGTITLARLSSRLLSFSKENRAINVPHRLPWMIGLATSTCSGR